MVRAGGSDPVGFRLSFTRRVLLAGGATLVAALAGCTRVSEFIVERTVGEVNVFNTSGRRLTGGISLVDPAGAAVLDERFTLPSGDDGDGGAIYDDVLTTRGEYQLTLRIETTERLDSEGTITQRLGIRNPSDEHVVVFLGGELTGEPVTITVVEDFSELEDTIDGS